MQAPYGKYGFPRDNRTLSKVLIGLFILNAVIAVAMAVITGLELMSLNTPEGVRAWEGSDLGPLDFAMLGCGVSGFAAFVALIVIFCCWKNRSCKNAWLLDPEAMSTTPAWSVGWYFIPIANLFKPYGAMRQIRDATCPPGTLAAALPVWWTLWILSNIADNASLRLSLNFDDIEKYKASSMIDIATLPLDLILISVVVHIIRKITGTQMSRLQEMPASATPAAPGIA